MNNKSNKQAVHKVLRKSLLGCLGVLLLIVLVGYLWISQYYKNHFYVQTFINEKDCSNLSANEATDVMNEDVEKYILTIRERDGATKKINGKDIDLKYIYEKDVEEILDEQQAYAWVGGVFKESNIENPYEVYYDEEKLEACIESLDCFDKDNIVSPVNAKISKYNKTTGFTIIKEEQGNEVDNDKVKEVIANAVKNMTTEISLDEEDCYKKPTITSESDVLVNILATINKYMDTKITYKFGSKTEVLDKEVVGPSIVVEKDNTITIDEDKIKEYISDLGDKYNTKGKSWTFKTSYGTNIKVKGGSYGFRLDTQAEVEEVVKLIKEGKQEERTPEATINTLSGNYQTIGDTYVELSIKNQHLFYYKNGKKVMDCPVVTGKVSAGNGTPTGVYYLVYKQRNRTLRGTNNNGTKYASFVNYWMPFNGGIGCHDATWRSSFGGTRYIYGGSHGCVNMPKSAAGKLYESIAVNTPIVVY